MRQEIVFPQRSYGLFISHIAQHCKRVQEILETLNIRLTQLISLVTNLEKIFLFSSLRDRVKTRGDTIVPVK